MLSLRQQLHQLPVLSSLTVTSSEGTEVGDTTITVAEAKDADNVYKVKVDTAETAVAYDDDVTSWDDWDGTADITAESGKVITVVEATSGYKARKAGHATVVAKAGE